MRRYDQQTRNAFQVTGCVLVVIGGPLKIGPYVDYLKGKYGEIYGLQRLIKCAGALLKTPLREVVRKK